MAYTYVGFFISRLMLSVKYVKNRPGALDHICILLYPAVVGLWATLYAMTLDTKDLAPLPAKLIFNPGSGDIAASPAQLMSIMTEMQKWNILPEVFIIQQGCDLKGAIADARRRHIKLFVVSGGDGTLDSVAGELIGTHAVLAQIPTGTRNNVAASLSIPSDLAAAVALIRNGHPVKVDVGVVVAGSVKHYFLENCSIGLLSALFPSADHVQHGNLSKIGEFLSTLVSATHSEMRLSLDGKRKLNVQGHGVLINNMPFVGPRYQVGPAGSYNDGELEMLVFADVSKLALFTDAIQLGAQGLDEARIQRFQVKRLKITTTPPMPVMADDFQMEPGPIEIKIKHNALTIIAGEAAAAAVPEQVPAESVAASS
jgi:diacylglycerol kinase (ATP)